MAVEKVGFPEESQKSGDQKCLGDSEKSFIELPDAKEFLRNRSERVFQQSLLLAPPISECDDLQHCVKWRLMTGSRFQPLAGMPNGLIGSQRCARRTATRENVK